MNESVKKRLTELEKTLIPEPCYIMAEFEDGTQREMLIEDWFFNHRHEAVFKKITKGGDLNVCYLLFAAWDEECGAMDRMEKDLENYRQRRW